MPGTTNAFLRQHRPLSLAVPLAILALIAALVVPAGAAAEAHPITGDWNGDGASSPGWFVDGTVILQDATPDGRTVVFSYGRAGDRPVAGDWNGDKRDTIGVVRGNRWYLKDTHADGDADHSFVFGRVKRGDWPLAGDWNGNGYDSIGVVRSGVWYLRNSLTAGGADVQFAYGRGSSSDVPVAGDWTGDGIDTPAVVRDGTWYLRERNAGGAADHVFRFGRPTDAPVVGDWNGDGATTPGVVRDSNWFLSNRLGGGDADVKLRFGPVVPGPSASTASDAPAAEEEEPASADDPGDTSEVEQEPEESVPADEPAAEGESDTSSATSPETQQWQFVSSGSQTSGRWQTFDLTIAVPSTLEVVADWKGDGNVNIFLMQDGVDLAYARSTTAKPERFTYDAEPGTYELAVLLKTGSASYVVDAVATPDDSAASDGEQPADADAEPILPPSSPTPEVPEGSYPGQPAIGTVWWGAAVGGNDDPAERHEQPTGVAMPLRRTFFQWRHIDSGYLAKTARGDLATGRLPWVSIKPPSWAEMASGQHDAAIDSLLSQLDGLEGPVWLTIHHEPEGGGGVNAPDDPAGPAGHLAMNRRVRERIDALAVDNVALAPVFMDWTFDSRSGRNIDEWWADGVYDFLGVDTYRDFEGSLVTRGNFADIRGWAASRGVDVAVGEWGTRGIDEAAGERVREWFEHAVGSATDDGGARVVGLAAFDSNLNSATGGWELQGEQLTVFHELMGDPRAARVP